MVGKRTDTSAQIGGVIRADRRHFFARTPLPWSAAFAAAQCSLNHREKGGEGRSPPPPDFGFGAHAAVSRPRVLTRDARRYRTCFPTVDLVAPE